MSETRPIVPTLRAYAIDQALRRTAAAARRVSSANGCSIARTMSPRWYAVALMCRFFSTLIHHCHTLFL